MSNSIIGKGTSFKGDLDSSELIRIDGDYSGVIRNEKGTIFLSNSARVKGNIYGGKIVLSGIFKGSIYAKGKLTVLEDAIVIGNIYTSSLEVFSGAIMSVDVFVKEEKTEEIEKTAVMKKSSGDEKSSNFKNSVL